MFLFSLVCTLVWNSILQWNPYTFNWVVILHLNYYFGIYWSLIFHQSLGRLLLITVSLGLDDWQILCSSNLIAIQLIFYIQDENRIIYSSCWQLSGCTCVTVKCVIVCSVSGSIYTQRQGNTNHSSVQSSRALWAVWTHTWGLTFILFF